MKQRERRRWLTERVCRRQYRIWFDSRNRWSDPDIITTELGTFKKRHAMECNCRKHRHGNPKIPIGICFGYERAKAFNQRRCWKRAQYALRGVFELIDYEA